SLFGQALLIPGADVTSIAKAFNLFVGFDEVWFFNERPQILKPASFWIVSPAKLGMAPEPAPLLLWMKESGSVLGLGDGIGLNYITRDAEIAGTLEILNYGDAAPNSG